MTKTETNNFTDIQDLKLQVYNRVVMLYNTAKDSGEEAGKEYLAQFSEGERKQMFLMSKYIKLKGAKEVARELVNSVEPTSGPEEVHEEEEILDVQDVSEPVAQEE